MKVGRHPTLSKRCHQTWDLKSTTLTSSSRLNPSLLELRTSLVFSLRGDPVPGLEGATVPELRTPSQFGRRASFPPILRNYLISELVFANSSDRYPKWTLLIGMQPSIVRNLCVKFYYRWIFSFFKTEGNNPSKMLFFYQRKFNSLCLYYDILLFDLLSTFLPPPPPRSAHCIRFNGFYQIRSREMFARLLGLPVKTPPDPERHRPNPIPQL